MGIADKSLDKQILYKVSKWTGELATALQNPDKGHKAAQ